VSERRLTEHGQERKQQLLDVAAELFTRRGFADTRIADICEAAGVAKGLFYWYFENKEALFTELIATVRLRMRQAQREAFDVEADALTQIAQGAAASLRFMAEHAAWYALLELETRTPELASVMRTGSDVHRADLLRLIRAGQDQGVIRSDDDAEMLVLATQGVVVQFSHAHRGGRLAGRPVEEVARFVCRWVVAALAADDMAAGRALAAVGVPVPTAPMAPTTP
jgi:AcrR family transcriptional regulator